MGTSFTNLRFFLTKSSLLSTPFSHFCMRSSMPVV